MKSTRYTGEKWRKAVRRRNFLAKDLHDPRYGPRVKEEKHRHMLDEVHRKEAEDEYAFFKRNGLTTKE